MVVRRRQCRWSDVRVYNSFSTKTICSKILHSTSSSLHMFPHDMAVKCPLSVAITITGRRHKRTGEIYLGSGLELQAAIKTRKFNFPNPLDR